MSRELRFDLGHITLAAQEWGQPGKAPILALHGWQDNSNSFSVLAPLIQDTHIIALDLAGHGQSDHRFNNAPYNIWEDVPEVFQVADQLGWQEFSLLGHSRGAIISTLAAGTFPERIRRLGLIEGLWPEPVMPEQAPEQLAQSIVDLRKEQSLPEYKDIASAVLARKNARLPVSQTAAELLSERGLKMIPNGYTWSTDPRLLGASAFKLTQDHIQAFLTRITAPIQLILAREGLPRMFEQYQEHLAMFPKVAVEVLPGGHHLHMEPDALKIAEIFHKFFSYQLS